MWALSNPFLSKDLGHYFHFHLCRLIFSESSNHSHNIVTDYVYYNIFIPVETRAFRKFDQRIEYLDERNLMCHSIHNNVNPHLNGFFITLLAELKTMAIAPSTMNICGA